MDNYFEIGPPVEERGLRIEAWQPDNDSVPQVLIAEIFKGEELLEEVHVPMNHPNMWGIDVEDMANFEAAVDSLVEKYGEAS